MTATMDTCAALYGRLQEITVADIPVSSLDRCAPRKDQAKAARDLFRRLGLHGISVTAPNYSMAQSVDVRLPREDHMPGDYELGGVSYQHHSYGDMPDDVPARAKMLRRSAAEKRVREILEHAFPNHCGRSNCVEDYFDHCWSFC